MAAEKNVTSMTVHGCQSEGSDTVADVVRGKEYGGVVCVGIMGLVYEAGEVGRHEECC